MFVFINRIIHIFPLLPYSILWWSKQRKPTKWQWNVLRGNLKNVPGSKLRTVKVVISSILPKQLTANHVWWSVSCQWELRKWWIKVTDKDQSQWNSVLKIRLDVLLTPGQIELSPVKLTHCCIFPPSLILIHAALYRNKHSCSSRRQFFSNYWVLQSLPKKNAFMFTWASWRKGNIPRPVALPLHYWCHAL